MKNKAILIILLFVLVFHPSARSQDLQQAKNGWKAGTARVVITPEESLWMAGYASRDHIAEGKLHELWSKALVIEDAGGKRAVLISNDLISIPKNISDNIRDRVEVRYGLSRSQIILNYSHTHSGPVLYNTFSSIYPLDDDQIKKIKSYSKLLEDQIVELVGKAIQSMVPAQIFSQNGVSRFQVNRRNNVEKLSARFTELNGPNDYAVPVIKVVGEDGEMIAVAFGYACHATVLNIYDYSGDFPGFAQIELEKLHPGVTAMFLQGAGADQNPLPRRTIPLAQQYGRTLAAAVERVLNEDMRKLSPVLKTAYSEIDIKYSKSPPTKEELIAIIKESSKTPDYLKLNAKFLINRLEQGDIFKDYYPYPCQTWMIGEQPLIAMGGELVIDYTIELKKIFGPDIFVLGYSNDVMAYIPSKAILEEGGYEGTRSAIFTTPWNRDIQSQILTEMIRLAAKTGFEKPELNPKP
jgi:Neutral/alkaline non-lysosomal ceramidase, N-terminal